VKRGSLIPLDDLEPRLIAAGYVTSASVLAREVARRIESGDLDEDDGVFRQADGEIRLDYDAVKALLINGGA